MLFLKRDFDVPIAVMELLKWADAIILHNATEGDNTEDNDEEDAGLRHTTNISICNVLPYYQSSPLFSSSPFNTSYLLLRLACATHSSVSIAMAKHYRLIC